MELEVEEEVLPLQAVTVSNVIPKTFDSSVVYTPGHNSSDTVDTKFDQCDSPPPNIGPTTTTTMMLHPLRYEYVLRAMVSSDSTRGTVLCPAVVEEVKDGSRAVVVVNTNADYKSRMPIYKCMLDELPSDEAYGKSVNVCYDNELKEGKISHHAGRHDARVNWSQARCIGDDG